MPALVAAVIALKHSSSFFLFLDAANKSVDSLSSCVSLEASGSFRRLRESAREGLNLDLFRLMGREGKVVEAGDFRLARPRPPLEGVDLGGGLPMENPLPISGDLHGDLPLVPAAALNALFKAAGSCGDVKSVGIVDSVGAVCLSKGVPEMRSRGGG